MRKVIFSMSQSLDGFFEGPDHELDWVIVDEEWHSYINNQLREMGAFLYGRRIYDVMVNYWPTAEADPANPEYVIDFARIWKDMPKIVFSKTLEKTGWNTRLIRKNITGEIKKMKEQPGKDLMLGGADIASTFMRLGLIDEIRLFINPVILGSGNPLFKDNGDRINLKLIKTRTFNSGVVELDYQIENKEILLRNIKS